MRHIITLSQAEELIESIPEITNNICHSTELSIEDYSQKINNHTLEGLVEITAFIYAKKLNISKINKRLSTVDERYMNIAENLLFGELSAALNIPINEVQGYIEEKIASTK